MTEIVQPSYPLEGTLGVPYELLKVMPKLVELLFSGLGRVVYLITPPGTGVLTTVPSVMATNQMTSTVVVSGATEAINLRQGLRQKSKHLVGLKTESLIETSSNHRVIYATSDIIRSRLLAVVQQSDYGGLTNEFGRVIVLSEAHRGTQDQVAIFYLLRRLFRLRTLDLKEGDPLPDFPRLLLVGEPVTPEEIAEIYRGLPIETLNVLEPRFEVQVRYMGRRPDALPNLIRTAMKEARPTEAVLRNPPPMYNPAITILIILGRRQTAHRLHERLGNLNAQTEVIRAYGVLDRRDHEALALRPQTAYRVVIATPENLSAFFLPSIDVIIDDLKEERLEGTTNGGLRTRLDYISRRQAHHRGQLSGQTRPGILYRLLSGDEFDRLSPRLLPEVFRVPLYSLLIDSFQIGMYPHNLFEFDNVRGMNRTPLIEMELIDSNDQPTAMGLFARYLPLAPSQSSLLYRWLDSDQAAFPGMVASTLIDRVNTGLFRYPPVRSTSGVQAMVAQKEQQRRYFDAFLGGNDLKTLLSIWTEMARELDNPIPPAREITRWAKEHAFDFERLIDVTNTLRQLMKILRGMGIEVTEGVFDVDELLSALMPIIENTYPTIVQFQRIERGYRQVVGIRQDGSRPFYELDPNFPRKWSFPTIRVLSPTAFPIPPVGNSNVRLGTISQPIIIQIGMPIVSEGDAKRG